MSGCALLYTQPEHVRMVLEELGATFIKLGQILSTRPDLLPPAYQAELAKLQDAAPTIPFEHVREALLAALGRPLEETFATFDPTPLAAASIGQVHAATLPGGTEVVVKVRRLGVVEQAVTKRRRCGVSENAQGATRPGPPNSGSDVRMFGKFSTHVWRDGLSFLRKREN